MTDEISLLDKVKAESIDYSGYYLTRNPFPETGKAPPHPSFCAGRNDVLNKIYDFIVDVYNQEGVSGLVILGVYGGGKTHVLRYVKDKINNELKDAPSGGAIAVYIERPQTGVLHIYSEFMSGLGMDFYMNLLWKIIYFALEKDINEKKITIEQLKPKRISIEKWMSNNESISIHDVFQNLQSLRECIADRKISKEHVRSLFEKYLSTYISDKDMVKCSVCLLIEDDLNILNECWRFLCGNRISKEKQTKLRLSKANINTNDINKSIFRSLINVFRACGFKAVFVLLDEVEAFASLGPQTRFRVLDEFRSFFDSILSNFGIILACIHRDWRQIINTLPALRDRIKHVVELGYMGPDEAVELVRAYLLSARSEKISDPLHPFTKEAILEIRRLKKGIVRHIVESCYVLLKEGARQKFPPITRQFVSRYIKAAEVPSLA